MDTIFECLRYITWNSSLNGNRRKFVSSLSIHECICYVFDTWLRKWASCFHVMLSYVYLLRWCRCMKILLQKTSQNFIYVRLWNWWYHAGVIEYFYIRKCVEIYHSVCRWNAMNADENKINLKWGNDYNKVSHLKSNIYFI